MGTSRGRGTTSFCRPRTRCRAASMYRWPTWASRCLPSDVETAAYLAPALIELPAPQFLRDGWGLPRQMLANIRERHKLGSGNGKAVAQVPAPLCVGLQEA